MKNSKVKDNLSVIKNLHLLSKSNNKVMNKQKILLINTHLIEYTKNILILDVKIPKSFVQLDTLYQH